MRPPMISLLEKSLGDRTAVLLGERAAADTLILTPRTVSGHEMLDAVCMPVGINPEDVLVLAGGMSMLRQALRWKCCTVWYGMLKI